MGTGGLTLLLAMVTQQPATHHLVREQAYDSIAAGPRTEACIRGDRIAVTLAPSSYVAEIDSEGVKELGQRGDGPGDFRTPTHIGIFQDTLWVADSRLRRITVFGPDRKEPRVFSLPPDPALYPLAYAPNGIVLGTRRLGTDTASQVVRLEADQLHVVATLHPSRSVTVAFGSSPADGMISLLDPFDDSTLFQVDIARARLVLVDRREPGRYAVRWLDLSTGAMIAQKIFTTTRESGGSASEDHASWWWYRIGARFPQLTEARFKARFVETVGNPRFLPPVGGLIVSASSHVWIQGHPRTPAETARWTILSPDGEQIGRVDVAPRRQLLAVDGDRALVLEDEEVVAMYRVMRRAASGIQ